MNLVKALRGELLDCNCCAHGWHECACDTVWPETVTRDAADEIERLTAELAEHKYKHGQTVTRNERLLSDMRCLQADLTEARDLAEHWAILAEQRRVELGECRKLQDLSYMDGLVMRMTYRDGDKVFNVQRVNTLDQLERFKLGAKFIVEVNADDMWQDLLAAMEAKP